jgi:hypothetical protein
MFEASRLIQLVGRTGWLPPRPGETLAWRDRTRFLVLSLLVLAVVGLNLWGLATTLPHLADGGQVGDWIRMASVDPAAPYANDFYRWAPPALWIWDNVVQRIGFWPMFGLHFAAIALLRPKWAILVVVVSWPFWSDAINGSTLTFVAVSASLAVVGNRPATVLYIVLCALMPRPLMLPVLAWILWHRPETRIWLMAIGVVVFAWSGLSGHLVEWVMRLVSTTGSEMDIAYNFGPSAWIGAIWIPIGLLLAAWLTWRGRLGFASVVASPYWFGYYLLMLIIEMVPRSVRER